MDYVFDSYFENNYSSESIVFPEFIYDSRRIYAKLYVFFKFMGIVVYGTTLSHCNKFDFFIIMIAAMIVSTLNSFRYEYEHFRRYGTVFSSLDDYKKWKQNLYPRSRILFSTIELIIKIIYFVNTFPPQCFFGNLCEIGESIFKIHILALLMIYIIVGVFCMFFCSLVNHYPNSHRHYNIRQTTVSLPVTLLLDTNQNEECCICLDIDNTNGWSMLPCGHKFHGSCVSTWLRTHQTCPICRLHMINLR